MALRVRQDGRIFCAALRPAEPGDTYIDDALHYEMSVKHRVLVTEPVERHAVNAQWWWRHSVPDGVQIGEQYSDEEEDFQQCDFCRERHHVDSMGLTAYGAACPECWALVKEGKSDG